MENSYLFTVLLMHLSLRSPPFECMFEGVERRAGVPFSPVSSYLFTELKRHLVPTFTSLMIVCLGVFSVEQPSPFLLSLSLSFSLILSQSSILLLHSPRPTSRLNGLPCIARHPGDRSSRSLRAIWQRSADGLQDGRDRGCCA